MPYAKYYLNAIFAFLAGKVVTMTAGGTGDNTLFRRTIYKLVAGQPKPQCAVVSLNIEATLAEGKTLVLTPIITTDDASNFATEVVVETMPTITLTGGTGGSTVTHHVQYNVDLGGCKEYVGIKATPNLNATGTDTASIAVAVAQSGFDADFDPSVYGATNHPELDLQ